ncbi:MAG: 3-hydroxybutyryl-CoA dehydrogenase [Acidobacteria bacterium]|nr:MAG: 3-hydroxybutyryl-CoA dehydrogenase [Acidobacteriota bacterium]
MAESGKPRVGIVGAGTMGGGIALVAAAAGHSVVLHDADAGALAAARGRIEQALARRAARGRLTVEEAERIGSRIGTAAGLADLEGAGVVIEAVAERLEVKREVLRAVERVAERDALLATNTSSLSIAGIGAGLSDPGRFLGMHFFNPAPAMELVEVVPALTTRPETVRRAVTLARAWGKTPVVAKDTPGFIVNRIARPFYGEALRILDEGIADAATVDWAMKEFGGFRMGPFELMDLIGNDVNFTVTETMFHAFYGEPRYRPSITQKRMVEAGRLGRKSGIGFYDYREGAVRPRPSGDEELGRRIFRRILVMLVNEAADAVFWGVTTPEEADLAMTKGVNYPKGLLRWGDEIGPAAVLDELDRLRADYGEERYRASPLLRRAVREGTTLTEAGMRGKRGGSC